VNRLATRGYLRRQQGGENDRREAFLTLIPKANRVLGKPSLYYPAELRREILSCSRPSGE
jgi:DNA-binding MarR family transcriptional regulator